MVSGEPAGHPAASFNPPPEHPSGYIPPYHQYHHSHHHHHHHHPHHPYGYTSMQHHHNDYERKYESRAGCPPGHPAAYGPLPPPPPHYQYQHHHHHHHQPPVHFHQHRLQHHQQYQQYPPPPPQAGAPGGWAHDPYSCTAGVQYQQRQQEEGEEEATAAQTPPISALPEPKMPKDRSCEDLYRSDDLVVVGKVDSWADAEDGFEDGEGDGHRVQQNGTAPSHYQGPSVQSASPAPGSASPGEASPAAAPQPAQAAELTAQKPSVSPAAPAQKVRENASNSSLQTAAASGKTTSGPEVPLNTSPAKPAAEAEPPCKVPKKTATAPSNSPALPVAAAPPSKKVQPEKASTAPSNSPATPAAAAPPSKKVQQEKVSNSPPSKAQPEKTAATPSNSPATPASRKVPETAAAPTSRTTSGTAPSDAKLPERKATTAPNSNSPCKKGLCSTASTTPISSSPRTAARKEFEEAAPCNPPAQAAPATTVEEAGKKAPEKAATPAPATPVSANNTPAKKAAPPKKKGGEWQEVTKGARNVNPPASALVSAPGFDKKEKEKKNKGKGKKDGGDDGGMNDGDVSPDTLPVASPGPTPKKEKKKKKQQMTEAEEEEVLRQLMNLKKDQVQEERVVQRGKRSKHRKDKELASKQHQQEVRQALEKVRACLLAEQPVDAKNVCNTAYHICRVYELSHETVQCEVALGEVHRTLAHAATQPERREAAYRAAEQVLAKALEGTERLNDVKGRVAVLSELGHVHAERGDLQKAYAAYRDALLLARPEAYPHTSAYHISSIIRMFGLHGRYLSTDQMREALKFIEDAFEVPLDQADLVKAKFVIMECLGDHEGIMELGPVPEHQEKYYAVCAARSRDRSKSEMSLETLKDLLKSRVSRSMWFQELKTRCLLAWAYLSLKRWDDAKKVCEVMINQERISFYKKQHVAGGPLWKGYMEYLRQYADLAGSPSLAEADTAVPYPLCRDRNQEVPHEDNAEP